jgi:hypothetical protein
MPTHQLNDSVFSGINIFLQSKDSKEKRENNSDCDFFLETIIEAPRFDMQMLVSVIDAEIPYSFYNITTKNNTLVINNIEISINPQNYSAFNIVDAFNEKFTIEGLDIVMSFNDNNNKFSLLSAISFTIDSTTMIKELGMDDLPQTTNTYISNKVCNLAGTSSIYIRSDNMNIQNINSFGKTNGVLSKVLVNTSPGNFIFFEPSTPQYFILGNSLNFINIQLLNDDNEFIDFNGLDWSLTLSIEYFRKKDDIINYKYFLNDLENKIAEKKILETKTETETKDEK